MTDTPLASLQEAEGLPELPDASMHNGVERGYSAYQMRAYATAALRSKPAANSSSNELKKDVNAAASNLNIAARYAKPEHAKLIVDAISLLRKLAPTNTSKQATGEAMAGFRWIRDDLADEEK